MAQEQVLLGTADVDAKGHLELSDAVLQFLEVNINDSLLALRGPREGSVLMWKPNKEDGRSVEIEADGSVVLPDDARKALFGDDGGTVAILKGPRPKCVIIWEDSYDDGYGKKSGF